MSLVSVPLAAAAAACNAVSSVLQRKANQDEPSGRSFGGNLLLDLVQRPAWLVGLLAMIVSFALQATALGFGTLSLVEPILVAELPLALVLAAWWLHRPLPRRDALTAVAIAAGLAVFLVALAPSGGSTHNADTLPTVIAAIGTAVGVGALALAAELGPARLSAAGFGAAAGGGFGLSASLMKLTVGRLSDDGVAAVFAGWQFYAMVAAGIGAVVLVQAALHAGTLVAAQPGITLFDPLVSVLWGVLILGERTRSGPVLVLAGFGAAILVAGVLSLVRSPTLAARD